MQDGAAPRPDLEQSTRDRAPLEKVDDPAGFESGQRRAEGCDAGARRGVGFVSGIDPGDRSG